MNSKVSVIIPTYRRSHMLGRAINSVLNQTYPNIEIVVVDDNSKYKDEREKTKKVISCIENDGILLIENKVNLGGALSRNAGVNKATGEYICFLDDDDEYYPEKIKKQLDYFEKIEKKVENLGMVYCQYDIFDESNKYIGKTENYFDGNEIPMQQNLYGCIAGTPTWFMKKSVFEDIKGFKQLDSGQDWNLILDVLAKGLEIYSMKESLIKVHLHEEERISISAKKLNSLLNEILDIKQKYIVKYPKKIQRDVVSYHFLTIANYKKIKEPLKSLFYFKQAIKLAPFKLRNIKFLLSIVVPRRMITKLKNLQIK